MYHLLELKDKIEIMSKYHQVEILRILKGTPEVHVNENNNGSFINLTEVSNKTLKQLESYIKYVDEQENQLEEIENEKNRIQDVFFKDNKDTTNVIIS